MMGTPHTWAEQKALEDVITHYMRRAWFSSLDGQSMAAAAREVDAPRPSLRLAMRACGYTWKYTGAPLDRPYMDRRRKAEPPTKEQAIKIIRAKMTSAQIDSVDRLVKAGLREPFALAEVLRTEARA